MIRRSFVMLDRIGLSRERSIWKSGICDWNSFLSSKKVRFISHKSKGFFDRQILKANKNLLSGNSSYFYYELALQHHWRLYDWFKEETIFIDIEADIKGHITIVGLFDGYDTKVMIKWKNLDFKILSKELSKYKLLVTFNGSSFDIPSLKRLIQIPKVPHFDLRFGCQKLGLTGGLKNIEGALGITRKNRIVSGMNGDCAQLWRMYMASGDGYYLDLLLEYNEEDVVNLERIADHAYEELKKALCCKSL